MTFFPQAIFFSFSLYICPYINRSYYIFFSLNKSAVLNDLVTVGYSLLASSLPLMTYLHQAKPFIPFNQYSASFIYITIKAGLSSTHPTHSPSVCSTISIRPSLSPFFLIPFKQSLRTVQSVLFSSPLTLTLAHSHPHSCPLTALPCV